MYDFRAQGIGHDPEGRPDVGEPSWLLTLGEPFRLPWEYAAGWLVDRLPTSDRESPTARNVAVPSSHLGMASNPFALAAVVEALA